MIAMRNCLLELRLLLREKLLSTDIHQEILGSDHCPVELVLDI